MPVRRPILSDSYQEEDLFLAGRIAPPGTYCRTSDGHVVILDDFDYLPATHNGQVACYVRWTNGAGEGQEMRLSPAAGANLKERAVGASGGAPNRGGYPAGGRHREGG